MKTVFIALVFLAASYANDELPAGYLRSLHLRTEFNEFVNKYNKEYSSHSHYEERLAIFAENLKEIQDHNLQGHSWKKWVNQFAYLTRKDILYLF